MITMMLLHLFLYKNGTTTRSGGQPKCGDIGKIEQIIQAKLNAQNNVKIVETERRTKNTQRHH
jgi:hypothetical protein